MNAKTTQITIEIPNDSTLERVATILGTSEEKLSEKLAKTQTPINIASILSLNEYAENQNLALFAMEEGVLEFSQLSLKMRKNQAFIERCILQNPNIFSLLKSEEKKEKIYLEASIKSMVKQKKNFLFVETFLNENLPENERENYFSFYRDYLNVVKYFFRNDTERYLFDLNTTEPQLVKNFLQQGFFEKEDSSFIIGKKLWNLAQQIYTELSSDEKQKKEIFLGEIFRRLDIPDSSIQRTQNSLWESLYYEIHAESEIGQVIEESGEDESTQEAKQGKGEYLEHKLQYALPYYVASGNGGENYQVCYDGKKTISMSSREVEHMTLKALENYMIFLKVFDELGLNFLSQRYRDQFLHIADVGYDEGEGISEGKLLKILNLLGKKIGVPEKKYEDEKGNKETGCFKSVAGGKLVFREIKETGKINNTSICNPSERGDYAIAEIYLMRTGFIDTEGKGLNVNKWH